MRRTFHRTPGALLLAVLLLAGCQTPANLELEGEAKAIDALVTKLHSSEYREREVATAALLARSPVSLRHLVVPRLALDSVLSPLEVSTRDGNIVRGRVAGGDERQLQVQITKHVARGAVVSLPLREIDYIRLFP